MAANPERCKECREVGMLHCSDPINCGNMKADPSTPSTRTLKEALQHIQAELIMAKQFLREPGTDPEAWLDGALSSLDALVAVSSREIVAPPETKNEEEGARCDLPSESSADLRDGDRDVAQLGNVMEDCRVCSRPFGDPACVHRLNRK